MKPAPFKYITANTVEQTLAYLEEYGPEAKILAGGQSLIPTMNFRLAQPSALIDINDVESLSYIKEAKNGGVLIGAMARHYQVEESSLLSKKAPMIQEAMHYIGHPQIRNRGTFGGSIVHSDPAAELPAVCVALNANFLAKSKQKERVIPASDFFVGLFATALEQNELLVEIAIPPMPARSGCSFQEVSRRKGDFALVGVAVFVTLDKKNLCQDAKIVFMGVGEGPVPALESVKSLLGKPLNEETLDVACEIASQKDIEPPSDIHASSEYRRHLARVLTKRALKSAVERATQK